VRQEAERQETARQETARREAERQQAAQREAAQKEAARVEAQEAEARREARLRAIGRQLDEEAARRDAAAASAGGSSPLPPPWNLRRYRLFGRTDPNEDIIRYAEAWERKIQLNTTVDVAREAAKERHADPLVTVAVRSDGSVESVTFVQSSGVAAIDDAIRRIVDSQRPYPRFPPSLAREYDVIEIRRTWYFDMAIRLY
jgi:TonB family protein